MTTTTMSVADVEATLGRLATQLDRVVEAIGATLERLRACAERKAFAICMADVPRARRLQRHHVRLWRRYRALTIRRDNIEDNAASLYNPRRHED